MLRWPATTPPALFWILAGGALLLAAAVLSFLHQLREVRTEVENTFSSRNALVEKFVALNQDKLEVMTLLLRARYEAAPAGSLALPPQADPAIWQIAVPLGGPMEVAPAASGAAATARAEGQAVVSGTTVLPLSAQQQREIVAAIHMAPQIRSAFRHDPDVFRLYYLSVQNFLYLAQKAGMETFRFSASMYERGYWLASTRRANPTRRMVLYGPYEDLGGRGQVVTFAQPVYEGDTFLGVVALDLGVEALQRLTNVGSGVGDTLMLDARSRLLAGQGPLKPGQVLRPPLSFKVIDWHEDDGHTLWLSSPLVEQDLWLVHQLPLAELYRAAALRSLDTWAILLLSGGLFVLALRLRRAVAEVMRLTQIDPLTQVLNRRGFYDHARPLLALARRKRLVAALAVFDIDHFKKINDTHGHAVGDLTLQHLGRHLLAALRTGDLFCRWGGEEFVLLVLLDHSEQALPVVERMRQQVQRERVPDGPAITLSAGLVRVAEDESLDAAVARADELLYQAKAGGRDRIVAQPEVAKEG